MNIGFKEDLRTEFKSDLKRLPDNDLIDAVVAFANTDGGDLYVGVEDDGDITGLHKAHKDITQLAAFIANKTVPPVSVCIEIADDDSFVKISVPKSRSIVASSSGKIQRRRIKADGTPENVPMYPHEIASRLSDLSLLDFSAQNVPDSSYDDLDDLERERLRNIIRNYRGETSLLELDNESLDKALRLATINDGKLIPTYCGMLLIGKTESIKKYIPTAEAAFQEMKGTSISVNESFTLPLLAAFEKIQNYIDARNPEEEIEDGLFRISVPEYNKRAFREALVNAFCHRDYTMMGRIRVLIDDYGLTISNPGGFIEGVTLDNLLEIDPHGRNTALADALKRIGLAERTGRGIDRIYEGSLLYGKPVPDYSATTDVMVKLFIPKAHPDRSFTLLVSEEQKKSGRPMDIDSLLVLNELKNIRSSTVKKLSEKFHINRTKTKMVLEKLTSSGLVEMSGTKVSSRYSLRISDNVRSKVIRNNTVIKIADNIKCYEIVIKYARKNNGCITRRETSSLLGISEDQAYRLLRKMSSEGKLEPAGKGSNSYYRLL
ncbi:MAG: putative DNA binding domain-containing protein [Oscillospiraceae bacterium]|nr:putative DNA binding domain-containing protein [Oscillospiraceae bacterium]